MLKPLYPLKFVPQLKDKIWGGTKLTSILGKKGESERVGESWEISEVEGSISVIENGVYRGRSLSWLLQAFKAEILGHKNYNTYGVKFPLLIKFIDAKEDLSVQLHPNNELARERHNSFGKTEMWHVMQADKGSKLIVGFKDEMNKEQFTGLLNKKSLVKHLNFESVNKGDTFFIDVGRIHAIGKGVLLAEIQQTSDITYRVYDWDRVDDKGETRELHLDLALDAIDFDMAEDFKIEYDRIENQANSMVSCSYFTTNFLTLNQTITKQNDKDSFIIYMCVSGNAIIKTEENSTTINFGETVLLPASIKSYLIETSKAELLEIYI